MDNGGAHQRLKIMKKQRSKPELPNPPVYKGKLIKNDQSELPSWTRQNGGKAEIQSPSSQILQFIKGC